MAQDAKRLVIKRSGLAFGAESASFVVSLAHELKHPQTAVFRGAGHIDIEGRDIMVIFGLSQTSGIERQLKLDRAGTGILLTISDHIGTIERERILVQIEDIMSALVAAPGQTTVIDGESPTYGAKKHLDFEIHRNEVWLRSHDGTSEGCDLAVGLDDFQDALEKITTAA